MAGSRARAWWGLTELSFPRLAAQQGLLTVYPVPIHRGQRGPQSPRCEEVHVPVSAASGVGRGLKLVPFKGHA